MVGKVAFFMHKIVIFMHNATCLTTIQKAVWRY